MRTLLISNLPDFMDAGFKNPFKALAELELAVKNDERIKEAIWIEYKDFGDIIFDLIKLEINGLVIYEEFGDVDFSIIDLQNCKNVIFTYQYSSTIS